MYKKGDVVEISGLKSKPEWNSERATISRDFDWNKGRYPVCLTVDELPCEAMLKPSNLRLIECEEENTEEKVRCFELKEMNGKGIGMIAACDISAGTIVFEDVALLNISRTLSGKDDESKREHIMNQFALLSTENKQKVLSYHNQIGIDDESEAVLGIYFTNSFMINNDASQFESAFFPNIARMNHSCFANCEVLAYDTRTESRSVVALFDIAKGEELSIYYIGNTYYSLSMPFKLRKQHILSHFNFECLCKCCCKYDVKMENYRRELAKYQNVIDEQVNNFNKRAFKMVLSASENMIKILNDGFNAYPTVLSQCYVNAAHALLFLNQYKKSINYLKKSVEIDQKYYGKRARFEDVGDCLTKIPKKFKSQFPWEHVLNLD